MITGHEEARVIHLKVLRPQIEIVLGRIPNIPNKDGGVSTTISALVVPGEDHVRHGRGDRFDHVEQVVPRVLEVPHVVVCIPNIAYNGNQWQ